MPIYCPSNLKYTKIFRKNRGKYSISQPSVACNAFIVKSKDTCTLSYKTFIAFISAVNKGIKTKGGYITSSLCFDFLKTKKPICSRMGGGKGARDGEYSKIFKGSTMLTVDGVSYKDAVSAVEIASSKLPIQVFVTTTNYIYA